MKLGGRRSRSKQKFRFQTQMIKRRLKLKSRMASIKMVIHWLMENSFSYDLTQQPSELKKLFPKLVLELKIPNEDALYRHAGKYFIRTTKFDANFFIKSQYSTERT